MGWGWHRESQVTHMMLQSFYEEQEDDGHLPAGTLLGSAPAKPPRQRQHGQPQGQPQDGISPTTDSREEGDEVASGKGPVPRTAAQSLTQPRYVKAVPWARSTGTGSSSSRGSAMAKSGRPTTAPLTNSTTSTSDQGWATARERGSHSHLSSSFSSADRHLHVAPSQAVVPPSAADGDDPLAVAPTQHRHDSPLPCNPPSWPPQSSLEYLNSAAFSRERGPDALSWSGSSAPHVDPRQHSSEMAFLGGNILGGNNGTS